MIREQRVLAVIPARGGSKRLPGKNVKLLHDKPLIAHTIEAAQGSRYLDRLILSSDDDEICSVAERYGCEVPFRRPSELASDAASGAAPVVHALGALPEYEYVVLLQPTSPLRSTEDIDGAIELCVHSSAATCVSVTLVDKHPSWTYGVAPDGRLLPAVKLVPELVDEPIFVLNGAVYVARCEEFLRTHKFVDAATLAWPMPGERSVDIDTEIDFRLCELLLAG